MKRIKSNGLKGETMKKLFAVLMMAVLIGLMAGVAMAATSTTYISLLVTPIATTSLMVSPTYYNFGIVAVKTSTCSTTALTLTNNGQVGVTVDKVVWDDDTWRVDYSSTTQDGFRLYAMVNVSAAGAALFDTGKATFTTTAQTGWNALTNSSAAAVTMNPDATNSLWFRLDMPKSTSNQAQKTIHVRIRGTSQ